MVRLLIAALLCCGATAVAADARARAEGSKKAVQNIKGSDDARQRAVFALNDISERQLVPDELAKTLAAVAAVSPEVCGEVVAAGIEESVAASALVKKRCGKSMAEVKQAVDAAPAKTKALVGACKLTKVPGKDPSKLHPWSLLLATVVADHFAADKTAGPADQELAAFIAYACPP